MAEERLDKTFDVLVENEVIELVLPDNIKQNLRYETRPYQIEAFARFTHYLKNYKHRRKPSQLLFHMATGSGKTLIMAGAIVELYKMGYRNFIFFVNTDTIIRKTKENFLNSASLKYLFAPQININNQPVSVREVDNFESANDNDINIHFSTIQGLHSRLNTPRENSVTFEDFANKKIVLISDEAHHVNSLTKKKLTGAELEVERSWENTITRIFDSNSENIMLEFTATLELAHPSVAAKYSSKLLFDYDLKKFREDGYSKEVKTMQADLEAADRALEGIIVSQYKKKVFSKLGLLIKPVVMMKSKTTAESAEMEQQFRDKIYNLSESDINKIRGLKGNETLQKAFQFFEESKISTANLLDELKDDFSEDKIISVNSKNDTDEKQIIINTLEAKDNEYRVVFAVDKLNEGWDVLNLYDIVRLYETRDSQGGKPGKTTVQEAQLIGRGARYFPFKISEEQPLDQRKFDTDLENEMRICEELHYHCSHNPRYIQELNTALQEIGIVPKEKKEVFLELKDDFKESKFYKTGFVFTNKKVENDPQLNFEYQEPAIRKKHEYKLRTMATAESVIFTEQETKRIDRKTQIYKPILWDKVIFKKAMNKIPFYHFNNMKRYFPSVKSVDDFISKKLTDIEVDVIGLEKDIKNLTPKDKLNVCLSFLTSISEEINQKFGDFRGTKSFKREPIRKLFRDKKMYFAIEENTDKETGKPTMRPDIDEKYYLDLNSRDWHAYKENYGSSEEKLLVKFLDSQMEELKNRFKDIYLLRNERFFKIFRFSDGKATEPDYVLLMTEKDSGENLFYQLFIEPKGAHLIPIDDWKEKFFADIEEEAILHENDKIRIIGMPFYNKAEKETQFKEKLTEILNV
ncbi:DEAD/DEAH box helicase family protein [Marinilabilia salmonicolor]|uniref:Type III restriction enzyme n=1 Tax=Marinilabilia salmonicolor TaxID=989 RepID=A0A368UPP6_9BACT|nr:DEAD/DEAH box helicase family protein [Marinilabilia salmonicolor]RCW28791.1 type III restriction enzyme [Marinilabilia salmonicolor]